MVGVVPHGIARYVISLSKSLRPFQPQAPYDLLFLIAPSTPPSFFEGWETSSVRAPFLHPREMVELPWVLKRLQADFYHSPSFSSLPFCPCPYWVTLHDLNHWRGDSFSKRLYYRWGVRPFARGAKRILTVSETIRDEIQEWIPDRPPPLVIPNAVEVPSTPLSSAKALLESQGLTPGGYFLALASQKPHKNLPLLRQAYLLWRERAALQGRSTFPPLVLPVPAWHDPTQGLMGHFSQTSPLFQEPFVFETLRFSRALFFPSLYEGFGLPPVEAVLLGVPCAVSDLPVHREIFQDLPPPEMAWFDPHSLESWVQAFDQADQQRLPCPTETSRTKVKNRYLLSNFGKAFHALYCTS